MRTWFRNGFYAGAGLALAVGIFLIWLWSAEHQVRRHTDNLLHTIENKDWTGFASFIAADYQDQWGHDRGLLLERTRQIFQYVGRVRLAPGYAIVRIDRRVGSWQARIAVQGTPGEVTDLIKERVNSLATPFQLEWHRISGKPWDWKLARVSNPDLAIPADLP